MNRISLHFFAALACTSLASIIHANPHEIYSDSEIEGPPYATQVLEMNDLAAAFPDYVQVDQYGASVRNVDMHLLRLQDKRALQHQRTGPLPAVLITGSTHGNEYLNIADRLPRSFLEMRDTLPGVKAYLDGGGVIYLLPVLNPDGYDRDQRANANGLDLNRDFPLIPLNKPGFSQPETKHLADYLEADLSANNLMLKVSMDYHCCIGALLYPWSYTNSPIASADLLSHQLIAKKMQDFLGRIYKYGTTYEILGYKPEGTSKDFYYPKFGALTYTFEGRRRVEDRNLDQHVQWWDWILGSLASQ